MAIAAVLVSSTPFFLLEEALAKHSGHLTFPRALPCTVLGSNSVDNASLPPTSRATPAATTTPRQTGSGPPKDTRGENSSWVSMSREAFPLLFNVLSSSDLLSWSSLRIASSSFSLGRTRHVAPPPDAETSGQHLLQCKTHIYNDILCLRIGC